MAIIEYTKLGTVSPLVPLKGEKRRGKKAEVADLQLQNQQETSKRTRAKIELTAANQGQGRFLCSDGLVLETPGSLRRTFCRAKLTSGNKMRCIYVGFREYSGHQVMSSYCKFGKYEFHRCNAIQTRKLQCIAAYIDDDD